MSIHTIVIYKMVGQFHLKFLKQKSYQYQKLEMQMANSQNFEACMILAAVGDAMGYYNGTWEFQYSGIIIHQQLAKITGGKGPSALKIDLSWRYSDDTVMHIATAKALSTINGKSSIQQISNKIAIQYKKCWSDMTGRAPGRTTCKSVSILSEDGSNWNKIPFNQRSAGCGASMRSACIGLIFPDIQKVIAVSIEAGRITHHNPIAYLGSVVSASFTYYAIKKIPIIIWGALLFQQVFPKAEQYIKTSGRQVKQNLGQTWNFFINAWKSYLKLRSLSFISKQPLNPKFPQSYGVLEREHFYKYVSYKGWGGASGHDSVIIAYDALLGCQGDWNELCLRGMLHGGDNDSTGTIAGAWFGAYYGYKGVPSNHKDYVQNVQLLKVLSYNLFNLSKKM